MLELSVCDLKRICKKSEVRSEECRKQISFNKKALLSHGTFPSFQASGRRLYASA